MTSAIVENLRQHIADYQLDGYIVPRADEWQGEYVAPYAERLSTLTGFSGSYGFAVIAADSAALFVDSRYTVQAKGQVDGAIFDILQIPDNRISTWLGRALPKGGKVGFDPWLFTVEWIESMGKLLSAFNITLVPVEENLVDRAAESIAKRDFSPVMVHPSQFSGRDTADKIADVKTALQTKNRDYFLINDPASVSWLLNIRAQDVAHTPYVLSRALVSRDGGVMLFVHPSRVDDAIQKFWGNAVSVIHPDEMADTLHRIGGQGSVVFGIDKCSCPFAMGQMLHDAHITPVFDTDPCEKLKACKNPIEIAGMRQAHVNDAVALIRFFCWLETQGLKDKPNEYDVGAKLHEFRADNPDCTDDSFDAIVGFAENGAIVHYRAEPDTAKTVSGDGLLLIDSGGQYPYGTTDITRTIAIGTPTKEMKARYTDVVKGHIALATARFPADTCGKQLDALARQFLWQNGCDYGHGTGHGVGAYLSVHEGPQSISPRGKDTPLEPGMVLSNEPGYYKENSFGIRFENLMVVADDTQKTDERPMLSFHTLSLFPLDLSLIDTARLTSDEIAWIDSYHTTIRETLLPLLDKHHAKWLKNKTARLKKTGWL